MQMKYLFDAKIRPTRKSKTITKKEHHKIAASTKKILKIAIKAGGTTLKTSINLMEIRATSK